MRMQTKRRTKLEKMLVDSFKGTDTKVVFNCYDIETQDA